MRFLHTADWHIGRTIRGRSRVAEFEAVLAEVVEIARLEQVDAMLVCGDIWDTYVSNAESDRIVFEALRECVGHGIQVVLLAGNHDNPRKFEALKLLSELVGIQAQGVVRRPNAGGVLTVEGRDGTAARIATVPFITEGQYVDAAALMGLEEHSFSAYADGVGGLLRAMGSGFARDTVNILASHLFIDGAKLADVDGSEKLLHIGRAYGVHPASLPSAGPAPQYIALGHIHQPQTIVGAPVPTAYSGSLLQLDFGERGQQKVVRIVELEPGRPPLRDEAVPLTRGKQLVELTGTLEEVCARAEDVRDAHVRVRLDVAAPEPGLAQRLRDAVPQAVDVQLAYQQTEASEVADESASLAQLAPEELFTRYYAERHHAAPGEPILRLFRELYEEAASVERVSAVASETGDG